MKSTKIDNEKKVIISVKDLYKTFKLPQEKHTSVKQIFVSMLKKKHYVEQKVLSGISFDVHEGDFFGIIGRNGSGKSTLLKILAGIYIPDSGSIKINGRISPFLELGVGFNPELSGYENVYLNGALLGLSRKEIRDKMDEIIDFSELKNFMDQKLKNYSSGMQVRLAFSVAIHAHAPIVLLDEVLAVGDANFQKKCQLQFSKMKKEGRTIIFVTHDMNSVRRFCNRAVLLSDGRVVSSGDVEKVTDDYLSLNMESVRTTNDNLELKKEVSIVSVEIRQGNKKIIGKEKIDPFKPFEVRVYYKKNQKVEEFNVGLGFHREDGTYLATYTSYQDKFKIIDNKNFVSLAIDSFPVGPYGVNVNAALYGKDKSYHYDYKPSILSIVFEGSESFSGIINAKRKWEQ